MPLAWFAAGEPRLLDRSAIRTRFADRSSRTVAAWFATRPARVLTGGTCADSLDNVLRRIDSAQLGHEPNWLTGRADLWLLIGKQRLQVGRRVTARRVRELDRVQQIRPVAYRADSDPRTFWRFEDRWFVDRDNLDAEQVQALLVTRERRRLAILSRAQAQVVVAHADSHAAARVRGYVSDEVKQFVWSRDQGRCTQCGVGSELQYDHVIPVALGGSSDANNLQILCGPCNRRKGVDVVVG